MSHVALGPKCSVVSGTRIRSREQAPVLGAAAAGSLAPGSPSRMAGTLKKHIEALSVLQWVLTYLFFGVFFTALLFYLLFTRLWAVSVLYFVWWVIDRDTPEKGGRRSDWVRNWRVWRHMSDYYPIKLVKTADLPPDRSYVLGSHPHGIACAGAAASFCSEGTGFSQRFPGLRPSLALLAGLFRLPLYREYMMSTGMCPVSLPSLDFLLSRPGNAVVIVVGGAAESLNCAPGQHRITLRRRTGFVRLALRHGAPLVPVYSFGENEIFRQLIFPEGSWLRRLQLHFKDLTGFAPCLFWGRGLLPFPAPITVVVGSPIPVPRRPFPTPEEVAHYHALYVERLQQLFERHKVSCGVPASCRLSIV